MTFKFSVSDIIPASPRAVYDAWLDTEAHSKMTGSKATASSSVGGRFAAWDGYISGVNLELVPGKRIVQAWRSSEFSNDDPDSRVTITLTPAAAATKLTLLHTRVPDGQTGYKQGWRDSYFAPMKAYFAGLKKARTPSRAKERRSRQAVG